MESDNEKKSMTTTVGFGDCQQEAISQNWLKLAKKIIKKLHHLSQISVPQTQLDHTKIDQSCF